MVIRPVFPGIIVTMRATVAFLGLVAFLAFPSPVAGDDYVIDEEAEHKARAQALHDAALEMAMAGNEHDALYDFEEATELDPTNAGFFSDLGVTQMRVGLLDEALASFMQSDELVPGTQLVQQNLKALQEHLDWRSKQQKVSSAGVEESEEL